MANAEQAERLRVAVQEVLWNVSNYPKAVQARLLGQDISALSAKVVAAALEAFLPTDETETVEEWEALDAMPTKSVVLDRGGDTWVKFDDEWTCVGANDTDVWAYLPVRVLYSPPVTREAQERGDAFSCADLGHEDCDGSHPDHHVREAQEQTT